MKTLLALCLALSAHAQYIALSVSPSSIRAAQSGTLILTFQDSKPASNISALEWNIVLPAGVTAGTPAPGASTTAAAKMLYCSGTTCILIGNNQNSISSGVLATVPITVTWNTPPSTVHFSWGEMIGVTGLGSGVTVTGANTKLKILARKVNPAPPVPPVPPVPPTPH